jgi:RNA polymerase sigma-70 factor (ECF subfamily)
MGDEAALCRELAPRIRAYGMRHGLGAAAAADLVQQALLVVIEARRAGRIEDPSRIAAFVFGCCKNLVRDLRRGEARRGRLLAEVEPVLAAAVAEARPPELGVDRLDGCLGRLPVRDRMIVVATFYAEQSGDEIAAELAISPANVRVIRHRALEKLRTCLEAAA